MGAEAGAAARAARRPGCLDAELDQLVTVGNTVTAGEDPGGTARGSNRAGCPRPLEAAGAKAGGSQREADPDRAGARSRDSGPDPSARARRAARNRAGERQHVAVPAGARADTQLRGAAPLAQLQAEKRLGGVAAVGEPGQIAQCPGPARGRAQLETHGPLAELRRGEVERSAGVHRVCGGAPRRQGPRRDAGRAECEQRRSDDRAQYYPPHRRYSA